MADEAQVKILKEQGVEAWNRWRQMSTEASLDLRGADLAGVNLRTANLSGVNLTGAKLTKADLTQATLTAARLSKADLSQAILIVSELDHADLSEADLDEADLSSTDLSRSDLSETMLLDTNFSNTRIDGTAFHNCTMGGTLLANVDLSQAKGLETVKHFAPSTIGIDTIYLSGGNIPEAFLRGAGVPEPFIINMKSLVTAMSPIEFYSCFISYSSKDQEFAERLNADLRSKNVRCWFAPEDLKIGDKLRPSLDEAIRLHDKLMVLVSENSVSSKWVEKEVETAFEKERREKRTVLFPIRLDGAVMETNEAWAADIRRTRHIGDFTDWKNHDSYKKAFERLLRDLKAEG
ncbi:MAG TPA: toll/interleukin-1 receptor domain-containing protein [Terriglobales bacterium]|nr:toll/interleukin-1 receptor domain-containing protein [Terriglobales bacterium]